MGVTWVKGEGPSPCEWMVVGEAPASEENRQGRPFVGKTGTELMELLYKLLGLSRRHFYITNAFKYSVPDWKKVTDDEWEMMEDVLLEEIEEVQPSLIITLGAHATRMMLGDEVSVEAANGVPHSIRGGVTIIPVIHPSAPFHDPEKMLWVREGFEVIKKYMDGDLKSAAIHPFTSPSFHILPVGRVMSGRSIMWEGKRVIGMDTETWPDMKTPFMLTAATGVSFLDYKAGGCLAEDRKGCETVNEWVNKGDVIVALHNAPFDIPVLRRMGVEVPTYIDTMQLAFLLQGLPIGLKPLAYRLCQWKLAEFEEVVGDSMSFPVAYYDDPQRATKYALDDAVATVAVLGEMYKRRYVGVEGVLRRDMDVMPMTMAMEEKGMLIDLPYLKEVGREFEIKNMDLLEEIREEVGMEDLNPNSPKQMNEAFYKKLGLGKGKRIAETVWGKSTGKNAMKVMRDEHPVVDKVEKYRETARLVSAYVEALPQQVGEDGRIHTDISLTRVQHSGRLASSKPNLMAIPVRTHDGRRVRAAFIAPKGYEIMSIDYSQIEMITMAHLSQDPVMMDAYRRGADIHSETAARIFGIRVEDVDEIKHRYPSKRTGFGIINHISPKGLARELADGGAGVWTESACRDLLNAWFDVYKGVGRFMQETSYVLRQQGYVTDLWGRRFVTHNIWSAFPHMRAESERVAGSALISGGAQGIIKVAMANLWVDVEKWMRKKWAWPLIQIHDDLTFETLVAKRKTLAPMIVRKMEGAGRILSLPTPVEVKVGKRWGDQKKVKV